MFINPKRVEFPLRGVSITFLLHPLLCLRQVKEHIKEPHHKASAKHRAMHSADSPSGSDSSNEDELLTRSKQRNLVAMSRKSKSQLKGGKCTPSICLEAAVASLDSRSTLRDPVWDRKKTLVLLDASAHVPSNDDIR